MLGRGQQQLCALSLFLIFVSCTSGPVKPSVTPLASDQTLRFPMQHDIDTLDPAMIDTEQDSQIGHNVFDSLLQFDANMNVVPDVASALPTVSADGLTYTFKLRTDVTFSNGDPVTAQDVLYSWNRAAAMQGPYALNLSQIAGYNTVSTNQVAGAALEALLEKGAAGVTMSGLSAPDEHTVAVKLSNPAGWFESAIAQPASVTSLVDRKIVKNDFDNWWKTPDGLVGTGAFKMSARSANALDFVALLSWWGRPKPTLSHVHVDIVSDTATALTQYQKGTSDLFGYAGYAPAVADVARIRANPSQKSQVFISVRNKSYWVSFNMIADASRPAGGPFTLDQGKTSHDLREAFALSVDRAALVKDLCGDIACAPATGGLIPKGLFGYLGDRADPLAAYDPTTAKSLLLSADPSGTKTKGLIYTYDPESVFNEPTARFLQSQWETNLGVKVELKPVPRTTFIANRLKGAYVLARDGWSTDYNHPQDWFDNLWGTLAGCPDTTCSSGYTTHAYDQQLARADAEPLVAAITDYKALSWQLINDVVYIPLYYTTRPMLIKPYVLGAGENNLFDFYWNQIQLTAH